MCNDTTGALRSAIADEDDPNRIQAYADALSEVVRAKNALAAAIRGAELVLSGRAHEEPVALRREPTGNRMTAHEAMRLVLEERRHALPPRDIAEDINNRSIYQMRDGRPIHSSQVSARAGNYPGIFVRVPDGRIGLRRWYRNEGNGEQTE
jgi:hypothetical protein